MPQGSAHPALTQSPENYCVRPGAQQGRAQSSSTCPQVQPGSASKTCSYRAGCYTCRTQGSTEGRSRPETRLPKDTGPAGHWPAHGEDQISVPARAQPQAPMLQSSREKLLVHVRVQLRLPLLGLWQEDLSQGSHHLCRESLPWLLPKTQTPTMTDPPLQGEQAPALDRDPQPFPFPFLETQCPVEGLVLQRPSLSAPRGCHQLAPHPGVIEFPSLEGLVTWILCNFFVLFYFFYGFLYFFRLNFNE